MVKKRPVDPGDSEEFHYSVTCTPWIATEREFENYALKIEFK